jgi:hypothetical protein
LLRLFRCLPQRHDVRFHRHRPGFVRDHGQAVLPF